MIVNKKENGRRLRDNKIMIYWNNLPEELRDKEIVAKLFKISTRTLYRIVNGK